MSSQSDAMEKFQNMKLPEIIAKLGSPFRKQQDEPDVNFFDSGFELQVVKGADTGRIIPLDRREVVLGRGMPDEKTSQRNVIFDDTSVDEIQAFLRWDDELERYIIYHHSPDVPTSVNGRVIKKSLLHSDYRIQFGNVVLLMVSIKEKKMKESAVVWDDFQAGRRRGEESIDSGFRMVVVEGPDKGESFSLDKNLLVIGRRKGEGDMRDSYGILLSDPKLPEELALLVWNNQEEKFEVYQSEKSPVPIRLFRVLEDQSMENQVGQSYNNLLQDKDSIRAGDTVLVIHRTGGGETQDAKIDIEMELSGPPADDESGVPGHTAPGHFRIDYVFEVVEGADTGHKVSLLSEEITEGRIITFGSQGDVRQNDIELDEPAITNIQGYLEFTQGNMYLINEAPPTLIYVNNYEIHENEKIVLNGGDRIKMGNTVLTFTDNRVIAALRRYKLAVIAGNPEEKGKRYPIEKTMMFMGRGSSCDIRVKDPEVSRLHGVLSFKGGRFHLEHKSKVNPTFVNGVSLKRGQSRIIFPGDKIYLSSKSILQLVRTGS